ncbi:hypothetical protein J7302_22325 [Pseudomonas sp. DB1]|uniref:Uncharacterized protein n=1 Tax=Metapseudomonas boanensis TaxID=2822138 RepID=A0ABS5XNF6_9GAMM|nr:hypothetical protein [Pseudomonas boanensis]
MLVRTSAWGCLFGQLRDLRQQLPSHVATQMLEQFGHPFCQFLAVKHQVFAIELA